MNLFVSFVGTEFVLNIVAGGYLLPGELEGVVGFGFGEELDVGKHLDLEGKWVKYYIDI